MNAALPEVPVGSDRLWGTPGPVSVTGGGRGGETRDRPGSWGGTGLVLGPGTGGSGPALLRGRQARPAPGTRLGVCVCLLGGHRPGPGLVPWVACLGQRPPLLLQPPGITPETQGPPPCHVTALGEWQIPGPPCPSGHSLGTLVIIPPPKLARCSSWPARVVVTAERFASCCLEDG